MLVQPAASMVSWGEEASSMQTQVCCLLYIWPFTSDSARSEPRTMYLFFLEMLNPAYSLLTWGYDCACGISYTTLHKYFPEAMKVVGMVHSNMHERVRLTSLSATSDTHNGQLADPFRPVSLGTARCFARGWAARLLRPVRHCGQA